jgi:hypothetical protein
MRREVRMNSAEAAVASEAAEHLVVVALQAGVRVEAEEPCVAQAVRVAAAALRVWVQEAPLHNEVIPLACRFQMFHVAPAEAAAPRRLRWLAGLRKDWRAR